MANDDDQRKLSGRAEPDHSIFISRTRHRPSYKKRRILSSACDKVEYGQAGGFASIFTPINGDHPMSAEAGEAR